MKTTELHIPFEALADLAEKLTADSQWQEERGANSMHLASCRECATSLQRLRQTISLMKSDREPDAPRDVLAYAVNIFERRRKTKSASVLRLLVAALTFDSQKSLTPAFGVRSAQSGSRQLIYSAEGHDVELRLSMQADQWNVAGQVLSEGCEGGQVSLMNIAGTGESTDVVLNQLCEFNFPPVPSGSYKLRLRLPDVEMEVPEFELKA